MAPLREQRVSNTPSSLQRDYAQWKIKSDWLDFVLSLYATKNYRNTDMAGLTLAEFNKVTEMINGPLQKALGGVSAGGARLQNTIDHINTTVNKLNAGVALLTQRGAQLDSALTGLGNMEAAIDATFSDSETPAAASAQPSEGASLAAVKAG